jgi:anti-sigma factor RsiW
MEHAENAEDRAGEGPCGDIAAYVLGVLDPAQREIFARHLAGCEGCERDAADFGMFMPVLRQSVSSLGPPAASRPCRITRSILLVAAGIVVAVAAVLSVVESLATHTDDPVELGSLLRADSASSVLFRQV